MIRISHVLGHPITLCVVALFFFAWAWNIHVEENALLSEGIETSGQVVDLQVKSTTNTDGSRTNLKQIPTIRFHLPDQRVIDFQGDSQNNHHYEMGDTVNVRYLPGNPNSARAVTDLGHDVGLRFWALLFGLSALVLAVGRWLKRYHFSAWLSRQPGGQNLLINAARWWSSTQDRHKLALCFALIFFLIGLGLSMASLQVRDENQRFDAEGLTTNGIVIAIRAEERREKARDTQDVYDITYYYPTIGFIAHDAYFIFDADASRDTPKVGDSVLVRYLVDTQSTATRLDGKIIVPAASMSPYGKRIRVKPDEAARIEFDDFASFALGLGADDVLPIYYLPNGQHSALLESEFNKPRATILGIFALMQLAVAGGVVFYVLRQQQKQREGMAKIKADYLQRHGASDSSEDKSKR